MSVRPRIITGVFLLITLVVVASTLVTYLFGNRMLRVHAREKLRREVISQLNQLESTVKDAETGQRGFIITGEERNLEPLNDAEERLPRDIQKFESMSHIDISAEEVGKVAQLVRQ